MARAAARDNTDLAGDRRAPGNDDTRIIREAHDVAMGLDEAFHRILNHLVGVIHKSLHYSPPLCRLRASPCRACGSAPGQSSFDCVKRSRQRLLYFPK